MADASLQILISAIDEATATLAKVRGEIAATTTVTTEASAATAAVSGAANDAGGALSGLGGTLKTLESNWIGVGAAVGGAIAAFTALSFLKSVISDTDKLGESTRQLEIYTGMSAQQASDWLHAAEAMGVSAQQLDQSFGFMSKNIENNMKLARESLSALGISTRDVAGQILPVNDILMKIADAFQRIPDGAEKTAAAMNIFGRSGKDMIPVLDQGSQLLQAEFTEAQKLGVQLSQNNVDAIHKHVESQREMSASFEGLKVQLGNAIMPALTDLANLLTNTLTFAMNHASEIFHVFIDVWTTGAAEILYHWSDVWGKIGGPVTSAFDFVLGIVHDGVNKIIDLINSVIDALDKIQIPDWVPGIGGKGINIPEVKPVGGDWTLSGIESGVGAALDKLKGAFQGVGSAAEDAVPPLDNGAGALGGSGGKGGGGLSAAAQKAAEDLQALAAGYQQFSDLTHASIPAYEDYLNLQKQIIDATAKHAAAMEEATNPTLALVMALGQIKLKLLDAGETIQQFLEQVAQSATDQLTKAFGGLFSSPTQEEAKQNLAIAQAQLALDTATQQGATKDVIDALKKKLDDLNTEKKLHDDQMTVLKDQLDVANSQLLTDKQRLIDANLYIEAMKDETAQRAGVAAQIVNEVIIRIAMMDAMQRYTAALGGQSTSATPAVPSYAVGTSYVPRTGLALVHQGEQIIPAGQTADHRPVIVNVYPQAINLYGDVAAGLAALGQATGL